MDYGLCRCGCGSQTNVAPRTHAARGWVKGKPIPYLRGHAAWKTRGPRWKINENGCWIWQRSFNNEGYPTGSFVKYGGNHIALAHRGVYELYVGPIPAGLELDHLCFVPACVNPAHLEPVTKAENLRRRRSSNTKASERDVAFAHELRLKGVSWRKIADELGMTHAPLITRVRQYCEQNGLQYQ